MFVFQVQVRVEFSKSSNETFVPSPLSGTLPVPFQPVQTKAMPFVGSGSATPALTTVPHEREWRPIAGDGSPCSDATASESFVSSTEIRIVLGPSAGNERTVPESEAPAVSPERSIRNRWVDGETSTETVSPSATHRGEKSVEPAPETDTSIQCSVRQFHVSDEASLMTNETESPDPVSGTLPVPVHPVQTRLVPFAAAGSSTLAVTSSP